MSSIIGEITPIHNTDTVLVLLRLYTDIVDG